MATTVARLQAVLSADTGAFDKSMDKSHSRMGKVGKAAGVAGAAIGGALVVGLVKSVKAAQEAELSQVKMESALKSVGIQYGAHKKQIESVIQSTSKLAALDDEDLQDAFTKVARATGDVNTALKDTRLAADLARGANISLEQATKAIVNTELGRSTGLRKLGVAVATVTVNQDEMKEAYAQFKKTHKEVSAEEDNRWKRLIDTAKAQDKAKTSQDALTEATKKYGGAAKAYGETATGQQERFKVALENVEESLGKALLPALTKVFGVIAQGTEWLSEHEGVTKALVIAVGLLAGALIAASAAQTLMNLAVLANPYVAATVAIIAAGVAIYVFRDRIMEVFNWIKDNWVLLGSILTGPVGAAVIQIIANIDKIKAAFTGVYTKAAGTLGKIADIFANLPGQLAGAISGGAEKIANAVAGMFTKIKETFTNIPGEVRGAIAAAVQAVGGFADNAFNAAVRIGDAIKDGVVHGMSGLARLVGQLARAGINALAAAWNAFKIPSFKIHIPVPFAPDINFSTPDIDFPNIPLLAQGAIVRKPTLAVVGEQGPEAVVPLGKGGANPVTVNVYGNVLTERQLVDAVYQGLLKKQTGGRLGLA